jgi:hypothetical protein
MPMIRIVIEIEGAEATVTTDTSGATVGGKTLPATTPEPTAPPEVLAAAAAIGAENAGPAPAVTGSPPASPEQIRSAIAMIAPVAAVADQDAGAAPGTPSETSGRIEMEDSH